MANSTEMLRSVPRLCSNVDWIPEAASVGIVTNNFHVYRGTRLAVKQGFRTVCGLAAPSDIPMQANNMVREFFGVMKDLLYGNMTL